MRTDTIEYFQNVADEVQSAKAKDIAREALVVIGELQRELAIARRLMVRDKDNGHLDNVNTRRGKSFGPG